MAFITNSLTVSEKIRFTDGRQHHGITVADTAKQS